MSIITRIKKIRLALIAACQRTKPIQDNKILFWSDLGHRYSCNPRYLSEYILQHHPDQYDVVWMFDADAKIPADLPDRVRVVRYFSRQWLYEIATAKYIVCNHRIPGHFLFQKRKKQVYIQTWHSSLRLKTIEGDAAAFLPQEYIEGAKKDSKQIDYIISGCRFSTDIFRRAFWYDGKILSSGTPRIDYLLNGSEDQGQAYQNTGLDPQCKYALYAPTFRQGDSLDAYDIDMDRLVNALCEKFGGTWKILYRLHPNLADRIALDDLPDCCINMTFYHDMQELLVISDLLITDYSSSMFDVAYLKKPCILYVSDLEQYVTKERALYFDIGKLPFLLAQNNEELCRVVANFDHQTYISHIERFLQMIGSFERGNACEQIYTEIIEKGVTHE